MGCILQNNDLYLYDNHPSDFPGIGPSVKYRPKFSFSSKIVTNIIILLGFWLIKVGNCYFYIHIKFPDHTVRIFYKIVINNIFRVVITSLLNSIPQ